MFVFNQFAAVKLQANFLVGIESLKYTNALRDFQSL
jgi:hypothetical protein